MPTPPFFVNKHQIWPNKIVKVFKLPILTYDEGDGVRAVQAVLQYSLALCVKRVDGLKIAEGHQLKDQDLSYEGCDDLILKF